MWDRPRHIDKKFTDRAWAGMRQVLDREMPAAPARRRRFAWWWWMLVGLGIGAGTAAAWHFAQKEKAAATAPAGPVALVPEVQLPATTASPPVTATAGFFEKKAAKKTSALPSEAAAASTASLPSAQPPVAGAAPQEAFFEKNTPSLPAEVLAEKTEPAPTSQLSPTGENAALANLPPLGLLSAHPLAEPPAAAPSVAAELPKTSALDWSVFGGGFQSPMTGGDGLGGGLLASLPLKNSRFSLEAGLGYGFVRQPLDLLVEQAAGGTTSGNPSTDDETASVEYAFNAQSEFWSKALESSEDYAVASQDLGLHYADLPLTLAWRAGSRWQLLGGASASFLLAAAPDFTDGGIFKQNSGRFDVSGAFLAESSAAAGVRLSKFDLALAAGARFQVTPRFGAELRLHSGLVDVIPGNSAGDFNRLLRLSFLYRL